jgi:hypothetical protein
MRSAAGPFLRVESWRSLPWLTGLAAVVRLDSGAAVVVMVSASNGKKARSITVLIVQYI